MNIFKKWYNNHQRTLFRRGFGWAITEYYIGNETIEYLQSYCDEASMFGDANSFDKGIKQAIGFIQKNESAKRNAYDPSKNYAHVPYGT